MADNHITVYQQFRQGFSYASAGLYFLCSVEPKKEKRAYDKFISPYMIGAPGKKPLKILVDAKTFNAADSTDPATWASFDEAKKVFEQREGQQHRAGGHTGIIKGVGFVFSKDDPYTGIDLDSCVDPDGSLLPWAAEVVERFDSFTERSISGTGLHVLIKGQKPGDKCKKGDVELYETGRFFALTGDIIGGRDEIHTRQEALSWFYSKFFGSNGDGGPKQAKPQPQFDFKTNVDAQTVLERARKSKSGGKIEQLLSGGNNGFSSDSEADQALCNHLVFFCGNIPDAETFNFEFARFKRYAH